MKNQAASASIVPAPRAMWDKLQVVLKEIAADKGMALAYSGGLDSRFLAHAAQRAGVVTQLLHVRGPHIPPLETMYARRWAAWRGFALRELTVDPLNLPDVAQGSRTRCYACKFTLFSRMREEADGLPLCDGTHTSDSQAYRPGRQALAELDVLSPLALAGLDKADIRLLGRLSGLENPDQRARPCLLTRLNYGLRPTPDVMKLLAEAEQALFGWLRDQYGDAWPDFRLRLTEEQRWELHIRPLSPAAGRDHTAELHARLIQLVQETSGLRLERVVEMENLSGYFDRPAAS